MKLSLLFLIAMVSMGGLLSCSNRPYTFGRSIPAPDGSVTKVLAAVRRVLASSNEAQGEGSGLDQVQFVQQGGIFMG